jgi:hypothetical protein
MECAMESSIGSAGPPHGSYQVPPELMRKLHTATEQFSAARKHLEAVLDSPNPSQRDKESAQEQIRRAGHELERLDGSIHTVLYA